MSAKKIRSRGMDAEASRASRKNICLIKMKSIVVAEDLLRDDNITVTPSDIMVKGANGKLQTFSFDTVIHEITSQNQPSSSILAQLDLSISSSPKFASLGFDSSIYINGRPRSSGPELESIIIETQIRELFRNVFPELSSAGSEGSSGAATETMPPTGLPQPLLGELIVSRNIKLSCYEIFDNRIRDLTIAPGAGPANGPRVVADHVDGLNKLDCLDADGTISTIRDAFTRRTCLGIAQDVSYFAHGAEEGRSSVGSAGMPTFNDSTTSSSRGFGTWTKGSLPSIEPAKVQLKGFKNGRLLGPVGHVFIVMDIEQHLCALRAGEMRRRNSKLEIVCLAASELLNLKPAKHEVISFIRLCDFNSDILKKDDGVKLSKKLSILQDGLTSLSTLTRVVKSLRNDVSRPNADDAAPILAEEVAGGALLSSSSLRSSGSFARITNSSEARLRDRRNSDDLTGSSTEDTIHAAVSNGSEFGAAQTVVEERVVSNVRRGSSGSINKQLTRSGSLDKMAVTSTNASSHVPYRDSLLTRLLRPSLEGNGCVFVVTLVNNTTDNINNVLRFASDISNLYHYIWTNETVEEVEDIPDFSADVLREKLLEVMQFASLDPRLTDGLDSRGTGSMEKRRGEDGDVVLGDSGTDDEVEEEDDDDDEDEDETVLDGEAITIAGDKEADEFSRSESNREIAAAPGGPLSANDATKRRRSRKSSYSSHRRMSDSFKLFEKLLGEFHGSLDSLGSLSHTLKVMERERNRCLANLGARRLSFLSSSHGVRHHHHHDHNHNHHHVEDGKSSTSSDSLAGTRRSSVAPQLSAIVESGDADSASNATTPIFGDAGREFFPNGISRHPTDERAISAPRPSSDKVRRPSFRQSHSDGRLNPLLSVAVSELPLVKGAALPGNRNALSAAHAASASEPLTPAAGSLESCKMKPLTVSTDSATLLLSRALREAELPSPPFGETGNAEKTAMWPAGSTSREMDEVPQRRRSLFERTGGSTSPTDASSRFRSANVDGAADVPFSAYSPLPPSRNSAGKGIAALAGTSKSEQIASGQLLLGPNDVVTSRDRPNSVEGALWKNVDRLLKAGPSNRIRSTTAESEPVGRGGSGQPANLRTQPSSTSLKDYSDDPEPLLASQDPSTLNRIPAPLRSRRSSAPDIVLNSASRRSSNSSLLRGPRAVIAAAAALTNTEDSELTESKNLSRGAKSRTPSRGVRTSSTTTDKNSDTIAEMAASTEASLSRPKGPQPLSSSNSRPPSKLANASPSLRSPQPRGLLRTRSISSSVASLRTTGESLLPSIGGAGAVTESDAALKSSRVFDNSRGSGGFTARSTRSRSNTMPPTPTHIRGTNTSPTAAMLKADKSSSPHSGGKSSASTARPYPSPTSKSKHQAAFFAQEQDEFAEFEPSSEIALSTNNAIASNLNDAVNSADLDNPSEQSKAVREAQVRLARAKRKAESNDGKAEPIFLWRTSSMTMKMKEEDDCGDSLSELEHTFLRAVSNSDVKTAERCIGEFVNINVKNSFQRDAMQIAARNGCIPMLDLLLGANGSIFTRGPRGDTLFHLAAMNGHIDTMRWLHSRGILPEAVDMRGQTALHVAARRGEVVVLKYLLSLGCNVMQQDFDGLTPYECIPRMGDKAELEKCRQVVLQAITEHQRKEKQREDELEQWRSRLMARRVAMDEEADVGNYLLKPKSSNDVADTSAKDMKKSDIVSSLRVFTSIATAAETTHCEAINILNVPASHDIIDNSETLLIQQPIGISSSSSTSAGTMIPSEVNENFEETVTRTSMDKNDQNSPATASSAVTQPAPVPVPYLFSTSAKTEQTSSEGDNSFLKDDLGSHSLVSEAVLTSPVSVTTTPSPTTMSMSPAPLPFRVSTADSTVSA